MDLSIVVLTFNSRHCIEHCVLSALDAARTAGIESEIRIFDNGSDDGTTEILQGLEGRVDELSVIYSPCNVGTTISRNAAIRQSSGEKLLILDSDAYLTPDCLLAMLRHLDSNEQCGLVGPGLTYASGNFQLSYDGFPTLQRKIVRFLSLRAVERKETPAREASAVDYLISACWMIPRAVYEEVGPLDEKIFYAPEDVDYCLRVWKAGYEVHYLPNVSMVHDAQELSRGLRLTKFGWLHLRGLGYFFQKHRYIFGTRRIRRQISSSCAARRT